jgi:hypothetical protein
MKKKTLSLVFLLFISLFSISIHGQSKKCGKGVFEKKEDYPSQNYDLIPCFPQKVSKELGLKKDGWYKFTRTNGHNIEIKKIKKPCNVNVHDGLNILPLTSLLSEFFQLRNIKDYKLKQSIVCDWGDLENKPLLYESEFSTCKLYDSSRTAPYMRKFNQIFKTSKNKKFPKNIMENDYSHIRKIAFKDILFHYFAKKFSMPLVDVKLRCARNNINLFLKHSILNVGPSDPLFNPIEATLEILHFFDNDHKCRIDKMNHHIKKALLHIQSQQSKTPSALYNPTNKELTINNVMIDNSSKKYCMATLLLRNLPFQPQNIKSKTNKLTLTLNEGPLNSFKVNTDYDISFNNLVTFFCIKNSNFKRLMETNSKKGLLILRNIVGLSDIKGQSINIDFETNNIILGIPYSPQVKNLPIIRLTQKLNDMFCFYPSNLIKEKIASFSNKDSDVLLTKLKENLSSENDLSSNDISHNNNNN